jgi:hypothetical protein
VLRSQRGRYVGCQMSSPPSPITFPDFPPLPLPPAPADVPSQVPTNLPPPVPSLIIVGTNVGTNLPPPSEPKPATIIIPTNPPVAVSTNTTNPISAAPVNPVAVSPTNAVAPPQKSDAEKKPLVVGGILLAVAGVLFALVVVRTRKPDRGSLITRSMNQKK